jgi:hypothetical protein
MTDKQNRSRLYANKIEALTRLDLPGEWFNVAQATSVNERFTHFATQETKILDAMDPKVMALATVLKDQFLNGGKPFRFDIYLNRPMSKLISEGDYIIYLVCVAKNILLQIKGIEHKTVLSHDCHYSDEQLLISKQLLENGN